MEDDVSKAIKEFCKKRNLTIAECIVLTDLVNGLVQSEVKLLSNLCGSVTQSVPEGADADLATENARLRAVLMEILIADTAVIEGSSDKPVLWYGLCAGMAKEHVNLSRDETLRLVRAKPAPK